MFFLLDGILSKLVKFGIPAQASELSRYLILQLFPILDILFAAYHEWKKSFEIILPLTNWILVKNADIGEH